MNRIDKDELYRHLGEFLKAKGIVLQEGSYSRTIEKGCQVLADTINLSQQAMERTKAEVGKQFDQLRQTIHEKTAPRPTPPPPTATPFRPTETGAPSAAGVAQPKRAGATKPGRKSPPPTGPRGRAPRSR